ncbi:MAG: gluconate 2-dehydrogenase subunit 3 family protein [Bryobacterales bacterium]|nr:gluconate 2-dehydrogenase subunit 3 family protein [Bryobacterales bacterium]
MERRTILKLAAAGILPGASGLVQLGCESGDYRPEFFSTAEIDLLDALSETILPADDRSPGARAAKVARYIDIMVADGPASARETWKSGLEAVSGLAQQRFERDFLDCGTDQQSAIVAEMARSEDDPQSVAERFFVLLKAMTIRGYYTSEIGIHQEFGYQGNTAIDEFPGCAHESHA